MKIGLVLSRTPAYSETFFISKIEGLQKNGFEVVLFVNLKDTHFDLCTVKEQVQYRSFFILEFFLKSLGLLLTKLSILLKFISLERKRNVSFKRILKKLILNQHILQESNVDWLHFGFATQAIGRENIAKAIGAKMAVSLRGFDIDVYPLKHKDCYSFLLKSVDKVHSISNYLLNKANILGLDKNTPSQIITPAIDSLRTNKSISKINKSKNLKICTIGRLHWIKNYTDILKSLKILKDKEIQFKYYIIGEGVLLEALKYEVYEYGLNDSVIFEGKLSHQETIQKLYDSQEDNNKTSMVGASEFRARHCAMRNTGFIADFIHPQISPGTLWRIRSLAYPSHVRKIGSFLIEIAMELTNTNHNLPNFPPAELIHRQRHGQCPLL